MNKQKFLERIGFVDNLMPIYTDMLCALVESAIKFQDYATEHYAKNKLDKWKTNFAMYKKNRDIIEAVIDKTWEEIRPIAIECMSDDNE